MSTERPCRWRRNPTLFVLDGLGRNLAEGEGFCAALIPQGVGITLRKFSCIYGRSKVQNGSRFGSRCDSDFPAHRLPVGRSNGQNTRLRVNVDGSTSPTFDTTSHIAVAPFL